jgi:hypothetical protein
VTLYHPTLAKQEGKKKGRIEAQEKEWQTTWTRRNLECMTTTDQRSNQKEREKESSGVTHVLLQGKKGENDREEE